MKQKTLSHSLFASLCAVLMLVLLILQFLPFWHIGSESTSISQYIWFPSDHPEVTEFLQLHTDAKFPINEIATSGVFIILFSVATLLIRTIRKEHILLPCCSMVASIAGIWLCVTKTTFRLGNIWWLVLVVCLLGCLASGFTLFAWYREYRTAQE